MSNNLRPIKVLIPGNLIERLDEVLQTGVGGFRTRHKFIQEAIDFYLLELEAIRDEGLGDNKLPEQTETGLKSTTTGNKEAQKESRGPVLKEPVVPPSLSEYKQEPRWASYIYRIESMDDVAVRNKGESFIVKEEENVSEVDNGPLFGLHNRDWPTLQALDFLARMTKNELVPLKEFYSAATANAWRMAKFLTVHENKSAGKLTSLLPNNQNKPEAAESNYQNFALGWVAKARDEQKIRTTGPIFAWNCAGLVRKEKELLIGPTSTGLELLKDMNGLLPGAPHQEEYAKKFLSFLNLHGGDDWAYFMLVLRTVMDRPSRNELIKTVIELGKHTPSVGGSLAQGYASRGREWGLIEPKQAEGRYLLTTLGIEVVNEYSRLDGKRDVA